MARERHKELPIDRGWAWVICFASFMCMFVTGTSMQALSVLFLELVNEFNSSFTITSLTVMCFVMSLSVSSVVSTSVLVPIFGERPVIIVAGALFAACSVGYFLAPNILVFIAFAAGKGMCVGLIFVPSISLLSFYFDRRRSLATTISNSGVCVASIVSPPIIRAITAEYGMRGTFLILAAVELHMVAAGLLMRPVSSYKIVLREDTGLTALDEGEVSPMKDSTSLNEMQTADVNPGMEPLLNHDTNTTFQSNKGGIETKETQGRLYDKVDNHVTEIPEDRELGEEPISNENHGSSKNQPTSGQSSGKQLVSRQSSTKELVSRQSSKKELLSRQSSRKDSTSHGHSIRQNSYHDSNWSISQKHQGPYLHRDSVMSVTSGLEPAFTGLWLQGRVEKDGPERGQGWKTCCFFSVIGRIFDPILFRQWSYRVFLISAVPSATSQYLLQYVPTIAVIKGATMGQAATLLTIIGSVDLVSRLAVGIFADKHLMRSTHIVAISQICQGILLQFSPLFNTYEKIIGMIVIMGLFIGTRQSLLPLMHIELVGIEMMARCLSITAMLATISAASHSPMLSAVLEATGSYDIVLHYVGVALIVGAVLMLFIPLLERIDKRHQTEKLPA